jgi:hypothetical protein
MNEEPDLLNLCAERAQHVHLRVGYDQGPQVDDPRAPEHSQALQAHLSWWRTLTVSTATPEFGPDGYGSEEGQLPEINRWMGRMAREYLVRISE